VTEYVCRAGNRKVNTCIEPILILGANGRRAQFRVSGEARERLTNFECPDRWTYRLIVAGWVKGSKNCRPFAQNKIARVDWIRAKATRSRLSPSGVRHPASLLGRRSRRRHLLSRLMIKTVLSSIRSCSPICRRRSSRFRAYSSSELHMSFAGSSWCSRMTFSRFCRSSLSLPS
jgi:hypothetical protein